MIKTWHKKKSELIIHVEESQFFCTCFVVLTEQLDKLSSLSTWCA